MPVPNLWQADGALGGAVAGQEFADTQYNKQLEALKAALDAKSQALQNTRYEGMTPGELAVSQSKGREANSKTDEYYQGVNAGNLGEAQTKAAKGYIDTQSRDSNLAKTLAENTQGKSAAEIKQYQQQTQNLVDRLEMLDSSVQGTPGPARVAAFQAAMKDSGMDQNHPLIQKLVQSGDIAGSIKKYKQVLMNTTEELQKIQEEKIRTESQERIGKGNNAATVQAAQIAAASRVAAATARTKQQQKLEGIAVQLYQDHLANPTPQSAKKLQEVLQVMQALKAAGAPNMAEAAGPLLNPNAPPAPSRPQMPNLGGNPGNRPPLDSFNK